MPCPEKTILKLTATIFLCVFLAPCVYAENSTDYSIEISQKAGRGLLNALSSPLEIPCAIRDDVSEKGAVGVGTGLFKGFAFFVRRLLVGVTEFGTFMIPMEETLPPVCAKKPAAQVHT